MHPKIRNQLLALLTTAVSLSTFAGTSFESIAVRVDGFADKFNTAYYNHQSGKLFSQGPDKFVVDFFGCRFDLQPEYPEKTIDGNKLMDAHQVVFETMGLFSFDTTFMGSLRNPRPIDVQLRPPVPFACSPNYYFLARIQRFKKDGESTLVLRIAQIKQSAVDSSKTPPKISYDDVYVYTIPMKKISFTPEEQATMIGFAKDIFVGILKALALKSVK